MSNARISDNHKAFYLSLMLAITDAMKRHEPGDTHLSVKRRKKLRRLEGEIRKMTEDYLPPDGMPYEDLQRADSFFDEIDARLKQLYPGES